MVKDASTEALALTIACRSSLEHFPHPITLIASNGPHLVPSKATRRQALGTPLAIEHISARFAQKEIGHPVFGPSLVSGEGRRLLSLRLCRHDIPMACPIASAERP